eukprot:gene9163-biopygen10717
MISGRHNVGGVTSSDTTAIAAVVAAAPAALAMAAACDSSSSSNSVADGRQARAPLSVPCCGCAPLLAEERSLGRGEAWNTSFPPAGRYPDAELGLPSQSLEIWTTPSSHPYILRARGARARGHEYLNKEPCVWCIPFVAPATQFARRRPQRADVGEAFGSCGQFTGKGPPVRGSRGPTITSRAAASKLFRNAGKHCMARGRSGCRILEGTPYVRGRRVQMECRRGGSYGLWVMGFSMPRIRSM